jgi:hypothetical protein
MVYIYVGVLNVNNKDIRSFNFASTSMYLKKAKLPEFRVAIKLKYKSIEGPKNEKMKLQNPMEKQRKACSLKKITRSSQNSVIPPLLDTRWATCDQILHKEKISLSTN